MPEDNGKILGMPSRTALWVIGGAVVIAVLFLAMRRRGGAPPEIPAAPGALEGVGGGAAGGAYTSLEGQISGFEMQMQELALKSAQQEFTFRGSQINVERQLMEQQLGLHKAESEAYQAALGVEAAKQRLIGEKLAALDPRKAVRPRKGKTTLDPLTGAVYGREEEHKGTIIEIGRSVERAVRPTSQLISQELLPQAARYYAGGYIGSQTVPRPRTGTRGTPPIVPATVYPYPKKARVV